MYVDGRADLKCKVLQRLTHEDVDRDLFVVELMQGFYSEDRNKFVRYIIAHKDNLLEAPNDR